MMATLLAALMCLPGRQTNLPKWLTEINGPEPCGVSRTSIALLYVLMVFTLSLFFLAGLKDPNLDRHATKGKTVSMSFCQV